MSTQSSTRFLGSATAMLILLQGTKTKCQKGPDRDDVVSPVTHQVPRCTVPDIYREVRFTER